MRVVVHDRTGGLPERLRTYAERKLVRLSRHFNRVLDAEVEFKQERRRSHDPAHVVTITVHMDGRRHPVATAHEEHLDRQTALDLGLDKIDRQVIKLKEKIKERKRPDPEAVPVPLKVSANGPARIRVKLRPESLQDAEAELRRDDGKHFHLFLDEDSGEIQLVYRREDGSIAVIEPVVT
ncbi:MAG TPA: ribosome-associated translation inhibitor RaiA [Candidatus Dormibacteraeota bacterium]